MFLREEACFTEAPSDSRPPLCAGAPDDADGDAQARAVGNISMRILLLGLSSLALTIPVATPALAQDQEAVGDWTLSGGVTVVSDYRFRGITYSDGKAAIQPTLTLSHSSGFYVGTWQSNVSGIEEYGDWEVDLYAGWSGEIAPGTTLDTSVYYYYFPDGKGNSDYYEAYATLSHVFGPVTASTGVSWAPAIKATDNDNYVYVFGQLDAAIPNTPVTLTGRFGRQDYGPSMIYNEWAVGASATFGPATASVQYVDTSLPSEHGQDASVIFSLGVSF